MTLPSDRDAQRLKEIRDRWSVKTSNTKSWGEYPTLQSVGGIKGAIADIDFLLSLIDSQDEARRQRREPYSDECRAAINELEERFESEDVELCSIGFVYQREDHAATTMRDACVEKVRAWANAHNHAFVGSVINELYKELDGDSR